MNMSDDVVSTTLSIAQTAATTGSQAMEKTLELIAKLLEALLESHRQHAAAKAAAKEKGMKSTDLTDIKPGTISIRKLVENVRKTGDSLSTSEQGLTKADRQFIAKKAKEYGIPVAFTGSEGKDNLYATVRTSDLPVFQHICTEMMQEKLAERPQTLGNFKVNEWEVPFITAELNKHDLSASFGKTKDGENFCLYEKGDEKAILIARGEFIRKCSEVEQNMQFSRDDVGFYHIQDIRSGQEITFDEPPTREVLATQMQQKFGLEESKAQIACAKFGEEMLQGQDKQRFFANDPQAAFSRVDANISVEGEHVLAKAYDCWRMTPKTDDVPRIVFRDQEGNFSVLTPESMTQWQMAKQLKMDLSIQDNAEVMALVDKARKVSDYYVTQQNTELSYDFKKSDFDMKNPDVVSGMLRTDEDGNTFAKSLPISSIDNQIERTGKDGFTVTITGTAVETDQNGIEHQIPDTKTLTLSFSDKKHALHDITDFYKQQGVPDHIAGAMAKDVFRMASEQSAQKVLLVEEVKTNAVTISQGSQTVEVPTEDPAAAVKEIAEKFDISKQQAETVLAQADEMMYPITAEDLDKIAFFREELTPPVLADAATELEEAVAPEAAAEMDAPAAPEGTPEMDAPAAPEAAPEIEAPAVPEAAPKLDTPAAPEAAPEIVAPAVPEAVTPKPAAQPMEAPAPAPKPLSEGMKYLSGSKQLPSNAVFLTASTMPITGKPLLTASSSNPTKAQFIMIDRKVYPNPLYKAPNVLKGFGSTLTPTSFKNSKMGDFFELPDLKGMEYKISDIRPASVIETNDGFAIAAKGGIDVKNEATGNLLQAPDVKAHAPKLPEFPKPELPAFRR